MSEKVAPNVRRAREVVYPFIVRHVRRHGIPPTLRQICAGTGLTSTSLARRALEILIEDELLEEVDDGRSGRVIRVAGLEPRPTKRAPAALQKLFGG